MTTSTDLDRVAQAYNAIRDARTAKRHAWEADDLLLEEQQTKLKVFLLSQLNALGAKSVATSSGTIYRAEKLKPSAADWGAVWRWMIDNDGMDLLERRLKTTFIKDYMEANDGALPAGVNIHREYDVVVRRS